MMKYDNFSELFYEKSLFLPIARTNEPKNISEYYVIIVGFGPNAEKRFIKKPKEQKGRK